jgi:ribonuclease Y
MSLLDHSAVIGPACFVAGALAGYWLLRWKERNLRAAQRLHEQALRETARREAETITREARLRADEEALRLRTDTERSFDARRQELLETEKRLIERQALITHELDSMVKEEEALRTQQALCKARLDELETQRRELDDLLRQRREHLERLGQLTAAEARAQLLKEVEQESLRDATALARRILDEARAGAEEKARAIVCQAIQRYAGEQTFETCSATVTLSGEELKGRIIGREGRNIRAFEAATGVTVLIDDTPNAVILSTFDPIRREVARESLHRLLLDGRIHPTRIEEVVQKVTEEINDTIVRSGEEAALKVGVGPLHPEVVRHLGRLRFRHSFSQNVLAHSVEVAHLMGLMAAELGLDVAAAKRVGLLHDIGKSVNHEVEGAHAQIGADLLRRLGESEEVVHAVAAHHDEVPQNGPLGILASAADAISASRPGARSETLSTYIHRMEELEKLGASFPGVEKCYAVQAGRELRVLVRPETINDEEAFRLARQMARKIEDELQYPGQIRVTVVRETRCVEFAK